MSGRGRTEKTVPDPPDSDFELTPGLQRKKRRVEAKARVAASITRLHALSVRPFDPIPFLLFLLMAGTVLSIVALETMFVVYVGLLLFWW